MIAELVASLGAWNWFILGLLLLAVEVFAPGTVILWLGLAALATGVVAFVVDPGWQGQLIAFAVLALIAVAVWWRFARGARRKGPEPLLNNRAELHIGRIYTLEEAITLGIGRVRIDDSPWRVSGPDLAAGTRVRVIAADGAILLVEPAD